MHKMMCLMCAWYVSRPEALLHTGSDKWYNLRQPFPNSRLKSSITTRPDANIIYRSVSADERMWKWENEEFQLQLEICSITWHNGLVKTITQERYSASMFLTKLAILFLLFSKIEHSYRKTHSGNFSCVYVGLHWMYMCIIVWSLLSEKTDAILNN